MNDLSAFREFSKGFRLGMEDCDRAPEVKCPGCGGPMAKQIGMGHIAGYVCSTTANCVGVEYKIEDLIDAEKYKAVTEDLLARKQKLVDMRTRNGYVEDPTPEQRRALKFCLTCRGYHAPTAEHPLCPHDSGVHEPFPEGRYYDFKGWRFRPPFHCMCCGKEICYQQWAFGRSCGTCDTGRCNTNHLHPRTLDIFCGPNTELIDPTEAEKFNFTPERIKNIPPGKPLEWYERKTKLGIQW